jgi:hypothetical protein
MPVYKGAQLLSDVSIYLGSTSISAILDGNVIADEAGWVDRTTWSGSLSELPAGWSDYGFDSPVFLNTGVRAPNSSEGFFEAIWEGEYSGTGYTLMVVFEWDEDVAGNFRFGIQSDAGMSSYIQIFDSSSVGFEYFDTGFIYSTSIEDVPGFTTSGLYAAILRIDREEGVTDMRVYSLDDGWIGASNSDHSYDDDFLFMTLGIGAGDTFPWPSPVISETFFWNRRLTDNELNAIADDYGFVPTGRDPDFISSAVIDQAWEGLDAVPAGWTEFEFSDGVVWLPDGFRAPASSYGSAQILKDSVSITTDQVTMALVFSFTGVEESPPLGGVAGLGLGTSGDTAFELVTNIYGPSFEGFGPGGIWVGYEYVVGQTYLIVGRADTTTGSISLDLFSVEGKKSTSAETGPTDGVLEYIGASAYTSSDDADPYDSGISERVLVWDGLLSDEDINALAQWYGLSAEPIAMDAFDAYWVGLDEDSSLLDGWSVGGDADPGFYPFGLGVDTATLGEVGVDRLIDPFEGNTYVLMMLCFMMDNNLSGDAGVRFEMFEDGSANPAISINLDTTGAFASVGSDSVPTSITFPSYPTDAPMMIIGMFSTEMEVVLIRHYHPVHGYIENTGPLTESLPFQLDGAAVFIHNGGSGPYTGPVVAILHMINELPADPSIFDDWASEMGLPTVPYEP